MSPQTPGGDEVDPAPNISNPIINILFGPPFHMIMITKESL